LTVNAAAAASFAVSGFPSSTTAGVAQTVTVTAYDSSGNVATGYAGTVKITSSDSKAVLPANGGLTHGLGSFSVTLETVGSQSITATDTVTSSITGTQTGIAVNPGAATHFVVSCGTSQTAGAAFSITVTAKDLYGNVATGYAGTVKITSSDGQAVLPANAGLASGVGSFSVTLKTVGSQSITATDTVTSSITGTQTGITVNPGAATHFVVSCGTTQTAGAPFGVAVAAYDLYGNVATGYAGTVKFTSSDGQAVLPANSGLTSGIGSFSFTLKTVGSQSITATDTVTSSITGSQTGITVTVGSLSSFVVSVPGSATAGSAFTLTMTAKDSSGNTITSYSSSVGLSASSGTISPTSASSSTGTWSNGIWSGSVTLTSAGSITVTANDGSGHTGTSSTITVGAGSLSKFVVGAPNSATAGSAFALTVTANDAYGNTITTYSSSVGLSASSGTISPTSTGTSGWANGVWTSTSATLSTAGSITVTANDGSGHIGTASVTVSAGSLATITVSGPSSVTAGGTATFTATGFDAKGNSLGVETASWSITSGAGGSWSNNVYTSHTAGSWTVTATVTGVIGTASLTVNTGALATVTVTGPSSVTAGGTATFTATGYDAAGNSLGVEVASWSISSGAGGSWVQSTATYTSNVAGSWTVSALVSGITGTASLTVGANVAVRLAVSFPSGTTQTAGAPFIVTVTANDAYGNVATGYTGTVAFSSSDSGAGASFPSNYAFLAGDAGSKNFTVTLVTTGSQTINVTDTAHSSISGTNSANVILGPYLLVSSSGSQVAGEPFNITVTAYTQIGEVNKGFTDTIKITSNDGAAVLPSPSTLTNGIGTFAITLEPAGTWIITAADTTISLTGFEIVIVS
jgi:hypothetical protein